MVALQLIMMACSSSQGEGAALSSALWQQDPRDWHGAVSGQSKVLPHREGSTGHLFRAVGKALS